jgi:two-component system sensor kinase FixL
VCPSSRKKSIEYERTVFEVIRDAVVITDDRGIIEVLSSTAERMFGYTRAEAVGRNVSMLMPSPYRERHDSYIDRYRETGEKRVIGLGRVVVGRRKDGSTFPIEINIGETKAKGRRLFTGLIRDLTERQATLRRLQELQEELEHVARLSALGEMASVLAHELNQPLTAIALYLQTSRQFLAGPHAPRRLGAAIEKAEAQVLRAAEIVRRLRGFVRKEPAVRSFQDLNKTVEEATALGLIGAQSLGISVSLVLASDLPAIPIERLAIQQVVVNLIRNAVDAMAASPTRLLQITTRSAASMIEVIVADTGPGIAPEIVARLFEPFVTSKPDGLGIGLSICRSIAENHRGHLSAEANPGGGTIFRLNLPTAEYLEA